MEFENVWKVLQWGYGKGAGKIPLYLLSVPAGVLAEKALIYRRTPQRRDGYQRDLSRTRLGQVNSE